MMLMFDYQTLCRLFCLRRIAQGTGYLVSMDDKDAAEQSMLNIQCMKYIMHTFS
jgi:hypothetical protein